MRLAICFALLAIASAQDSGREAFEKGLGYFNAEEYELALPLFEEAYEASAHRPPAIFMLAQCERMLKRYDRAIAHYREYLATKPPPEDAAKVEKTIDLLLELEKKAAVTIAPKPPPPPPPIATTPIAAPPIAPIEDEDDSLWESPIFWIGAGAVALIAVGAGVALSGQSKSDPTGSAEVTIVRP